MPYTNFKKSSAAFLNRSYRLTRCWTGLSIAILFAMMAALPGRADTPALCKKEVPRITFENISPPFDQYDYFQNRLLFPFEYDASAFSLINAWWLAEISTLVYSDTAYIWQRLRQAGFKQVQFIQHSGTYCFVAANDRFAIVAFRGSEIWRREEHFDLQRVLADLTTNIDIRLSDWADGERVHSGFKAALEDVWTVLQPEIEKLHRQDLKIWLTGHSLGAALATLAALAPRAVGVLGWRPIVLMGQASYVFYLLHQNFGLAILNAMPEAGAIPSMLMALAIQVAIGETGAAVLTATMLATITAT